MLRAGRRLWRSGRGLSLESSTRTASLTTLAAVAGVALLTGTASSHSAGVDEERLPAGGAPFRASALLKLPGRLGRDVFTAAGMCRDVLSLISLSLLRRSHLTRARTLQQSRRITSTRSAGWTRDRRLTKRAWPRVTIVARSDFCSCASQMEAFTSSWGSTLPCSITCCRLPTSRP